MSVAACVCSAHRGVRGQLEGVDFLLLHRSQGLNPSFKAWWQEPLCAHWSFPGYTLEHTLGVMFCF